MKFVRLSLVILALCWHTHAVAEPANAVKPVPPPSALAKKIVEIAISEHRKFDGHRINANGYLWTSGLAESESEALHDPDTGRAGNRRSGGPVAWRQVWEYWLSLAKHVQGEAMGRKVISVPGLLDDPNASGYDETALRELLDEPDGRDNETNAALRQAAVRAAMNDAPWSAAFISHIMDSAGLSDAQFRYASAHWRFIQRAFDGDNDPDYAYRARDPRKTTPRPGDLLCYARGGSPLKSFAEWRSAVKSPGFSIGSHCEVVVRVDLEANKLETIGGNVLHSVARRQLKLNEAGVLSDSHHPDRARQNRRRTCPDGEPCPKDNLNLEYWSVLLQLRPESAPDRLSPP
jgi:hypothetical protein